MVAPTMVAKETGTMDTALAEFDAITVPIDKYIYLRNLQSAAPGVFFQLLTHNVHDVLPYVYTPTVGEACERYHELPLNTWGLYITLNDKGSILEKLKSWRQQDVKVIVVTDGERILGLGDLGAGGMGISEGKILLYTVAAGVDPRYCLPVCLDVGTNNQTLLDDPSYKGLRQKRITGQEYDDFVEEFICAVKEWQKHVLLQFEDFGNQNAFRVLNRYQPQLCCFNDDIQGTACVCLAGMLSAMRASKAELKDTRVLFLGAGEAGVGIGELIAMAIQERCGVSREEARKHCFFMDSKGLVCQSRDDLQHHKVAFAHDVPAQKDLVAAIRELKPTALFGVSTIHGAFTQEVIEAMCEHNDRPIVFPLSNPTSKAECTYEQAFRWSQGKVLFASGSPFDPITVDGVTHSPAQANNAYVFPALGHAAVIAGATSLPEEAFLLAAESLAKITSLQEVEAGHLFPHFDTILSVSKGVILEICEHMEQKGLGSKPADKSWEELLLASTYPGARDKMHSKL